MNHPFINYIYKNQVIAGIMLIALILLMLELKEILILVFLSYTIMASFIPFVRFLVNKGINKTIAALFIYLLTISVIIILIIPLVPFFTNQIQAFSTNFPEYVSKSASIFGIKAPVKQVNEIITSEITNMEKAAFDVTSKIFGGFFSTIAVIAISFYMLLNHDLLKASWLNWFSAKNRSKISLIIDQIEEKLGAWVRGQLILSVSVGILTGIALSILGLNYVLPLAVIAGILEIIPTIGPIISAIPAVIVALIVSPTLALTVIIAYIVIQFFENHVLVPNIMQKSVGLNPVVIIITILIGGKLLGILGALLSIPFVSILVIIFNNSRQEK